MGQGGGGSAREVVEKGESVLVEGGAEVSLGHGESDGVGESCEQSRVSRGHDEATNEQTLSKRSGGNLDTLSNAEFGVSRSDGIELAELLLVSSHSLQHSGKERTALRSSRVTL